MKYDRLKEAIKKHVREDVRYIEIVEGIHDIITITMIYGEFGVNTVTFGAHVNPGTSHKVFSITGTCNVYTIQAIDKALKEVS